MKRGIKKFLGLFMCSALFFSTPTFIAGENAAISTVSAAEEASTRLSAYRLFDGAQTYTLGSQRVGVYEGRNLTITMEKTPSKLLQGTIYMINFATGQTYTYGYSNFNSNTYKINMSNLPDGTYQVKAFGNTIGLDPVGANFVFD